MASPKKAMIPNKDWEKGPGKFIELSGPLLPVIVKEQLLKMKFGRKRAYPELKSNATIVVNRDYYLCSKDEGQPELAFLVRAIKVDKEGAVRMHYYDYTAFEKTDIYFADIPKDMRKETTILEIPEKGEEKQEEENKETSALEKKLDTLIEAQKLLQEEVQMKFREFQSLQKQQDNEVNEVRKAKGQAVANNLNKGQKSWEQQITKRRPRPVTVSNVPYVEGENLIQIVQKVFDARNEKMQDPSQRVEMKFTAKRAIAKDAKIDQSKAPPKIIVVFDTVDDRNVFLRNPKTAIKVKEVIPGSDKDENIYVNESLSKNKRELFYVTKLETKKLGIQCRAKDNKVWIKPGKGVPEMEITSVDDIEEITIAWNDPMTGSEKTKKLRQYRKLQLRLKEK